MGARARGLLALAVVVLAGAFVPAGSAASAAKLGASDLRPGQTGSARPRLSTMRLAFPVAILGLLVLVLVPVGAVGFRRARDRRLVRGST